MQMSITPTATKLKTSKLITNGTKTSSELSRDCTLILMCSPLQAGNKSASDKARASQLDYNQINYLDIDRLKLKGRLSISTL